MTDRLPLSSIHIADNARRGLGSIQELRDSIAGSGWVQPLTVRQIPGGTYELIAGHRRFAAVSELHQRYPDDPRWASVPVQVVEAESVLDRDTIQLVENAARSDLNWLEVGRKLSELHRKHGVPQRELCFRLGRYPNWVSHRIKVAEGLEPDVAAIIEKQHTSGAKPMALHDALKIANCRGLDRQKKALEQWQGQKQRAKKQPASGRRDAIPRKRAEALLQRLESDPTSTRREKQIVRWLMGDTKKNPLAVGQRNPPPPPTMTLPSTRRE